MRSSHALVADLEVVSAALDDPDVDLHSMLAVLIDDFETVVPSFVGVEIILRIDDVPVSLVVSAGADGTHIDVEASLLLPMLSAEAPNAGSLIVYAAVSGAFSDLADDAQSLLTMQRRVGMDVHLLPIPADGTGIRGFQDFVDVNQAVGVLIAEGHNEPTTELKRRAHRNRQSIPVAARKVLAVLGEEPMAEPS